MSHHQLPLKYGMGVSKRNVFVVVVDGLQQLS